MNKQLVMATLLGCLVLPTFAVKAQDTAADRYERRRAAAAQAQDGATVIPQRNDADRYEQRRRMAMGSAATNSYNQRAAHGAANRGSLNSYSGVLNPGFYDRLAEQRRANRTAARRVAQRAYEQRRYDNRRYEQRRYETRYYNRRRY